MPAVSGHDSTMSPEAMAAATGRLPADWFALLDAAGATAWTHTAIAAWLADEHGVQPWWRQAVTVRYEQARGMRVPGQQSDGTFAASKSKRFAADQSAVLDAAIAAIEAELGPPASENRESRYLRARWRFEDGSRLVASADPTAGGTAPLTLTIERIPAADGLDAAKQRLAELIGRVAV